MLLIETMTGFPAARTSHDRRRMVSEATAEPPPESIRSITAPRPGSSAMSRSVSASSSAAISSAERTAAAADQPRRPHQRHARRRLGRLPRAAGIVRPAARCRIGTRAGAAQRCAMSSCVAHAVDQARGQRLLAGEWALVDQPLHLLGGQLAALGDPATSCPLRLSSSASSCSRLGAESWLSVRLSSAVLYSSRRSTSMRDAEAGQEIARERHLGAECRSGRPDRSAAARSRRRRWRDSSPRCRSRARRRCRHRRWRTCRPARNRRTASRSSWVTARPLRGIGQQDQHAGDPRSRCRGVQRQHDLGHGRRRPQLEVEQIRRARGLAEAPTPVGRQQDPVRQSRERAVRTARPGTRPPRSRQQPADGGEQADQEAAHEPHRAQAAFGRRVRLRWLSVRSWPQAARMSRPRGVRTGEAWPASSTIRAKAWMRLFEEQV